MFFSFSENVSRNNTSLKKVFDKRSLAFGFGLTSKSSPSERNTVEPPLTATSPQRPPRYNGHLATTATSLQQPLFLADSPYIDFCFNLSPTATLFCPQGDGREVQLYSFCVLISIGNSVVSQKIVTSHEFVRVSFH